MKFPFSFNLRNKGDFNASFNEDCIGWQYWQLEKGGYVHPFLLLLFLGNDKSLANFFFESNHL